MRSIRASFLFGGIVGVLLILTSVGIALVWVVSRSLQEQFDDALAAEIEVFASMLEFGEDGLVFDVEDLDMRAYDPEEPAGYLRAVLTDGARLFDSPGLAGVPDLGAGDEPRFGWVTLHDERVRAVEVVALPRIDDEWEDPVDPQELLPARILVARPDRIRGPLLARMRNLGLVVLLGAMVITGLLMTLLSRRSLRGLDHLAERIGALPVDGTTAPLEPDEVPQEAEPIVERLNALLLRVRRAVEHERALSVDVAHELRTPIAGLRSLMEVSLHRERAPAEYQRTLRDTLTVVTQTERMVERLLRLHRVEVGDVDPRLEVVTLAHLVQQQWGLYEPRARQRALTAEFRLDPTLQVQSDPDLLALLLSDLLDNAVSHSDQGGSLQVWTESDQGAVVLAVANSGSHVDTADVPRLLERFSRGDPGRAGTGSHMGLGLTLVARLVQTLGLEMEIRTNHGGPFTVRLTFPARS